LLLEGKATFPICRFSCETAETLLVNLDRSETLGNIESKIETEVGGETDAWM
jgi:hypothetical protein